MTYQEREILANVISLGKRMDEHMTYSDAEDYRKSILNEMAYERKMFKAILTNLSSQILENWCLIRYAKLSNTRKDDISHWKSELIAHISNAANNKIKGNNSIASRVKAISEVWTREKEYSQDINTIKLAVLSKFLKENIDINSQEFIQSITDCSAASLDIIDVIASADADNILGYVSNL